MQNKLLALAALLIPVAAPTASCAEEPKGDVAWDIVSGLTTEIGQRLAGSPREAAARDWGKARLEKLGFVHVAIEPFPIKGYVRGTDAAMLTAPVPQRLAVAALGYSGSTSDSGPDAAIEAPLVYFQTLADL